MVGIDGCRGGWVVAAADPAWSTISFSVVADLAPLFARADTGDVGIAIDIPIGLSDEGPQDRIGGFTWVVGPKGPFRFHIRAKAVDKAGNTDTDQTREPVLVDLEHPKVIIQGIGAGGGR